VSVLQSLYENLVGGEYLSDFFDFLDDHVNVVSLLEDELFQLDVGELFFEVLEELWELLNDLISQLHQVVPHVEHLMPRVGLRIRFSLQSAFVRMVRGECFLGLEVRLREEEGVTLNGLHSQVHLLQYKLSLMDELQENPDANPEGFECVHSVE